MHSRTFFSLCRRRRLQIAGQFGCRIPNQNRNFALCKINLPKPGKAESFLFDFRVCEKVAKCGCLRVCVCVSASLFTICVDNICYSQKCHSHTNRAWNQHFSQPHEKVSKWFVNFNTRCGFIRNTQLHVNGNVQESNKKTKTNSKNQT